MSVDLAIDGRASATGDVDPDGRGGARIRQTAVFDPAGYVGLAYWYLFCRVHEFGFSSMLRGIARAVETAPTPS